MPTSAEPVSNPGLAPAWAVVRLVEVGWKQIDGHADLWTRPGPDNTPLVLNWQRAAVASMQPLTIMVKQRAWWEHKRFVIGVLTAVIVVGMLGPQIMDALKADSPLGIVQGLATLITAAGAIWFTASQKATAVVNAVEGATSGGDGTSKAIAGTQEGKQP